jgi:hypothetical protein
MKASGVLTRPGVLAHCLTGATKIKGKAERVQILVFASMGKIYCG